MRKLTFLLSDISIPGGIQRVVSQLVNELVKTKKYEITLLSIFKKNDMPFFYVSDKVNIMNLFTEKFDLRKNYIKVAREIQSYIKGNEVGIFINCGMGYVPLSFMATRRIKTVSWEHSIVSQGKKYGMTWWGRWIASKRSDSIVVITKEDLENYRSKFKKINRIEQIYNLHKGEFTKNEYNSDLKQIMSCGSLVYLKGYDLLIKVAKLVFEKHQGWTWNIYGDGVLKKELEELITENGLDGKVVIKGYSTNIEEKYRNHSIFVLTSRSEGFGMVLVEAQKNKLPIVSFKCPSGPSEIVSNKENGFLVECYDTKQMADSICNLIENRKLRIKFSNKTHDNLYNFDPEIISKKWDELFDSL